MRQRAANVGNLVNKDVPVSMNEVSLFTLKDEQTADRLAFRTIIRH